MRIGIIGCAGRMGRMLVAEVLAADNCRLLGGTEQAGSEFIGQDIGELIGVGALGLPVGEDAAALFAAADAVIDFTTPAVAAANAALAADHKTALIVGATGLEAKHQDALRRAAGSCVIVQAANMSVGVNLLLGLTERVAAVLGDNYDIEIVEMHHRHKVDAPSGTALALGSAAAEGRGVDLNMVSRRVRDGHTGDRNRGEIGFATLRGGDVVGDHTVIFAAEGERIELTHKASSRTIFAGGAVKAALWTKGRPPGLYSMRNVLGF
ncbi:MAG: 4-hydroxy-tetrahydrodipicolinate reductase [Rhodospirillales bacterium RIFCSPLOWO2_12_FULL_58_28]|nr:MAG: 4-hydroxy-tetrahydrodipicolinate reductase [Rhodospirillales bacterium RIFCSPLOWO2_02_FULL_58_16]OHC79940.1 MAG: 4-hydroxy-tetrahydrodipicolinate reductase [Rhodospirillales bacterium RIFCSPLOWO2_12_FULL_58_28]